MLNGREAVVVKPQESAVGQPWVWRAEFFDAFAAADMALLEQGWHIAYYRISHLYGCPEAIQLMKQFHAHVLSAYALHPQSALFGFSRGGLYAFNYAATYPDDVCVLYLDAPVLDIRSWPAGRGQGTGSPQQWAECKAVYGITEEEAEHFDQNPLDRIKNVANSGIPIFIVAGDADTVVPLEENAAILAKKYKELGGTVEVIIKPGVGHHPHSLEQIEPIVTFIQNHRQHC
jgi:pimeloyl-ACP methyl ester carboxylesterase